MRIELRVDGSELIRKLEKGTRRLAFGTAAAINNTAKRIQRRERANVRRTFKVRQKKFMERQAAIIKPFANAKQGRPYAEISVGRRPRLLLSIFERGGIREPFKGDRVAVPITGSPARPRFGDPVPEELRFKALKFRKTRPSGTFTKSGRQRRTKGGKGVRFGLNRTYLVPAIGVFQRGLGDAGESKLLYIFTPPPRLRRELGFIRIARREADRWFREEMEKEKVEALRRSGFR